MTSIWIQIELFVVLLARTTAFIFVIPVLGNRTVPLPVKVGFSIFLTLLLFPLLKEGLGSLPDAFFPFALLVIREVVVGLSLGFITQFIFAGVQMAGEIVGRQMGFGLAQVMDPESQEQVPVLGEFYMIVIFLIYLVLDGHHFLLSGFAKSYQAIPLGKAMAVRTIGGHVVQMGASMFEVSVQIGAPIIVSLLLANVALGILARTVPQMNVFIVGLPLRIGLGFIALSLTMVLFLMIFKRLWLGFQMDFSDFIRLY